MCFTSTIRSHAVIGRVCTSIPMVVATVFHNGAIWTGTPDQTTDAVLVVDGVIEALGEPARRAASDVGDVEEVDLDGGFLMAVLRRRSCPSAVGRAGVGRTAGAGVHVGRRKSSRRCGFSRDEHPDDEWIVGASYDGSLAPDGLFDARWLDAAVPDRPVVLRAWDYHTAWCNSVALDRAGITADTPDPVLGEIPHREDGSVLGTLREWGAVDLMTAVMPQRDEDVRVAALGTAADYYLARGVTWVQDAWVEPGDVDTYVEAARRGALRIRFNLGALRRPPVLRRAVGAFRRGAQACRGARIAPADRADGEVLRRRCGGERDRRAAGAVLLLAAQPRHAGVGGRVAGRGGAAGRRPRPADPHPRDRRRRGPPGAGRHRVRRRFQRPARPAAGHRTRATHRRR